MAREGQERQRCAAVFPPIRSLDLSRLSATSGLGRWFLPRAVFSQALLMVAGKPEMLEGGAVGAQLVGRHSRRREALLAEQLAHQLDGRRAVSTTLDQDLEDLALVVDGTPQIHALARDPDDHFIEMPAIARSRTAPSQTASDRRSEFEHPTANALVGDVESTLGKQLLDIAIA